jgi:membrane-associated phospholipid phosphatase
MRIATQTLLISFLLFPDLAFSQLHQRDSAMVPFSRLFFQLDSHLLGSFSHNYGVNHLLAVSGTYGIVHTGIDWRLHSFVRDNKGIAYAGFSSVIIGGLAPLGIPLWLYLRGRSQEDKELQITALALGQAALVSLLVSSSYKAVTGRHAPEILEEGPDKADFSKDFRFGFMERGVFDGWPSGHTMAAFSMATTLMELYAEDTSLKFYALLYASAIGLGVSTNIHWFSDAFAGALIGASIGKTVGRGFRKLKGDIVEEERYSIMITPFGIGMRYVF